jgi:hypothetical protein
MITYALRYVISVRTDLLKECIERVLPIKEFPHIDTGRAQAKTVSRIRVEENGPVIKLLPEHD